MDRKELKRIKSMFQEGLDDQAKLINGAFQEQKEHFDSLIGDLKADLKADIAKVDDRLQTVEIKLDRAWLRFRLVSLH